MRFGGKVHAEKCTTQSVLTAKFESIPKISSLPACVSNYIDALARQK